MSRLFPFLFAVYLANTLVPNATGQDHPSLVLTREGANTIRTQASLLPLLHSSLETTILEVEAEMAIGVQVPVPKDMAGGYTHERHKQNFLILQKAGVLYQITQEDAYAAYVRDVLLEYATQFPTWSIHPAERSYAPGKIFWQCLNDANWLVYMSQAYDCIYDFLGKEQRKNLETNLFRPLCDHISVDSPQFFNRIHNHSTWGNAGVGMMGLVMKDRELIQRSLYGLSVDDIAEGTTDDDGGLIRLPGQAKAGFLAQIDHAFSPDGFYTEGPYYQRYAMYPFLLFAQAIHNHQPERNIFAYRDSVLRKAVYVLLNLTNSKGEFFPFNDAQKGMSWYSRELISSIEVIYHFCGKDPKLLSIARKQGQVLLDDTGLSVAQGLANGKEESFVKRSMELKDGQHGDEGAVGILRTGPEKDELCLVMKYTGQGLSHGHYDKLSFMLYDKGAEVLQDYGLARFVNIDQKYGGGYLPENTSWAKQTIAHNTLCVNQLSHFNGDYQTGVEFHSDPFFFDSEHEGIQIVSAKEDNAYPGVSLHRTMALVEHADFEKPLVLDVFRVEGDTENQCDLPFYFKGQVMLTDFEYHVPDELIPMGSKAGYQHLWIEGAGKANQGNTRMSWLSNSRFYTFTSVTSQEDSVFFTRIGASDPHFNLRRDAALMLRKHAKNTLFVSLIESHGHYSPVSEIATNSYSSLQSLEIIADIEEYTAVAFSHHNGTGYMLIIANRDPGKESLHTLEIQGKKISWIGPFLLQPCTKD